MIPKSKRYLIPGFEKAINTLRAEDATDEDRIEAFAHLYRFHLLLGERATYEDIGTTRDEVEQFLLKHAELIADLVTHIQQERQQN